jgi:hypothetical protein
VTVRDPYDVLGVAPDASAEAIQDAYRHLAERWHPDRNPNDPVADALFKEIAAAYDILSHADKRAAFDRANASAAADASPAADVRSERPRYSGDGAFASTPEDRAELGEYVEQRREERGQNERRPSGLLIALAAYVALTFAAGMFRGFSTELDGVIESQQEITVPVIDALLYIGEPVSWNWTQPHYWSALPKTTKFTIRRSDGRRETFAVGPACSLLSNWQETLLLPKQIHKVAGHWDYQLNGRTVSDFGPNLVCVGFGSARLASFLFLLTVGLLYRPAWAPAVAKLFFPSRALPRD